MPDSTAIQGTFASIAELSREIEGYSLEALSQTMSPELVRRTTVIHLSGGGELGAGEDATPIEDEQLGFQAGGARLGLAGEGTVASFSSPLPPPRARPAPGRPPARRRPRPHLVSAHVRELHASRRPAQLRANPRAPRAVPGAPVQARSDQRVG